MSARTIRALLDDPLYLGLRQHRVRGDDYLAFVDEFVAAVQQLYPKCCIQWEDFANLNAVPILARYRDKICTFNDDIQGTAGVALAGIFAALRLTGQKLAEQRFLFLGAGSAATGIAELISLAMAREGMDLAAARRRNALFDINGLLVTSRTDLADFQKPFAQDRAPVIDFRRGSRGAAADRHHRRQHRAEAVHPRGDRGDGRGSTSARSSSRIRTRPRAPNARPKRPIAGPAAAPFSPAAVRSRRSRSPAAASCPARATTFTSSRPWAWRCLPPKRCG